MAWQTKKLGEICDILDNQRKPVTQRDRISGKYPYYGATGIQDYVSEYIFDEKLILIGEDGAKWGAGENTAFIAEGKYWVNNHAHVIRPHRDVVLDNWIVYFLNVNDLSKYITGLTVQKLNQGKLREIEIPLPPISEQKRILKILDEVFEKTAKAQENTEKNMQNSKELFESYLQKVFANPGNDWREKALGETCDFFNGKAHEKCIDEDGGYVVVNSKFISSDGRTYKRTKKRLFPLFEGDIVMVMSDVPNGRVLAKCFLIDKDDTYSLNQRICAIRSKVFENKFLYYQLSRNKYFLSFDNGENQTNLRKNDILNCPLLIPSISEQKAIVKKLDALLENTKKIARNYEHKLSSLEEFKKSLLKKAFAGGL